MTRVRSSRCSHLAQPLYDCVAEFSQRRNADNGGRGVPKCGPELLRRIPQVRTGGEDGPVGRLFTVRFPRGVQEQYREAREVAAGDRRPQQGDRAHLLDGQVRLYTEGTRRRGRQTTLANAAAVTQLRTNIIQGTTLRYVPTNIRR